ncbi:MAG: molybdenum cofactor guanylyltransferase [Actinomycetota bacterium]|nr:molybdenum cofactor guanylyltransferase [Actinomycetota bacterium]
MENLKISDFGGAVLAGGFSKRMGFDKALLELDGKPLITRVTESLLEAGLVAPQIVGGDIESFRKLGYSCLEDEYPGEGPLGGIITALNYFKALEKSHVFVVACDLPNISASFINQMCKESLKEKESVIVAMANGYLQWMHTLWPTTILETLIEAFKNGERAAWRAIKDVPLIKIDSANPDHLLDIDRPEDLEKFLNEI